MLETDKSRLLLEGERIDDLQCKGYEIIQDPKRFCFGVDAVLLAHYARVKEGDRVLDLGTGTGIIPILLNAITPGAHFTGLEIQAASVDMAKRSVLLNGIGDKVDMIEGDIKEAAALFDAASFQVVTSNPPYMTNQHALQNDYEPKTIARHEVLCTLEDVVAAAAKLLVPGGRFYMIHKPFRLPEIISVMKEYRIEPKELRMIHPYVDKEPTMVLIGGVRGGRPMMKVAPPLVLYKEKNVYTDEVYKIYKS
ncbi:MAG: tRNA1(Val) (adenine(37)-N6)-methyltransferase [Lachnospiraceae bacterium]|nr:tRNA1(Val) (adenine(37)-N6)-methyltransferase [Lachnospiraceae bacterium]